MNQINNNYMRECIKELRGKGYQYKIFWKAINYAPSSFYNFMHGAPMSYENLSKLKNFIDHIKDNCRKE